MNRKGFTLIELLIVVVIIGILAAIAIPKFANTKQKAIVASMKSDLRNLVTAQEAFFSDNNDYAGAVILITHDRSLMELVADRLWLAADGTVAPFDGDMDDYARLVLDRAKGGSAPAQNRAAKKGKRKAA